MTRNRHLGAACSVGKWPRARAARGYLAFNDPIASVKQRNYAGLHCRQRPHFCHHFWQSFQPIADEEERVSHATILDGGQNDLPELRTLTVGTSPQTSFTPSNMTPIAA